MALSRGRRPVEVPVTELADYGGQSKLVLAATQLGTSYTARDARRVVDEWVGHFAAGPSAITDLEFATRTPKRLFAALRSQTQLRRLAVKWGDYEDLSLIAELPKLAELSLKGASSVKTLEPLRMCSGLTSLTLESLKHVRDLSPLGDLHKLVMLDLGGDWMSNRTAHVESLAFLRHLPNLEALVLHSLRVDDRDYSPILALPRLQSLRVGRAPGMKPEFEQLAALPCWDG